MRNLSVIQLWSWPGDRIPGRGPRKKRKNEVGLWPMGVVIGGGRSAPVSRTEVVSDLEAGNGGENQTRRSGFSKDVRRVLHLKRIH